MQIVAAFTAGDSDNLMVGRNGIFYDREGRDWDATITKIVDNPISIRQAFWSPVQEVRAPARGAGGQARRRGDAESHRDRARRATATAHVDNGASRPSAKKIDVGTVAALGVAVGGIGAFVTA